VPSLLLAVALVGLGPIALAAPAPPRPKPAALPPAGRAPDGSVVGGPKLGSRGIITAGRTPLPGPLTARGWVLADLDTGNVLAARDPHGKFLPASTLKLLTGLTLIPRLNRRQVVTASADDVNVDGTRVGLVPGGKYSVDLLFQTLFMMSGNDSANALARTAGGTAKTLVLMNEKARDIRAYDTHAATPSGLDGPRQSISAYDLALITRAAFALGDFRRYDSQLRGRVPAQPPKYKAFDIANQNRLVWDYPGGIGGKTGFTDAARHTYVGIAERNHRRLVVTFLYAERQPVDLWVQGARLLDWGFAQRTEPSVGELVAPGPPPAATPGRTVTAAPTGKPAQAATDNVGTDQPGARKSGRGPLLGVGAAVLVAAVGTVLLLRRLRRPRGVHR
jgi:D-alanyl-D-alanine carboxypeptidase (penicillin-binding protein 5/6)